MLTPDEQSDILIRLDERVAKIREDQQELKQAMESDKGFTRCQLHTQKMEDIENSLKWTKKAAWAAVLTIIGKIAWKYMNRLI